VPSIPRRDRLRPPRGILRDRGRCRIRDRKISRPLRPLKKSPRGECRGAFLRLTGMRHTILVGPPGTGKTRWAREQISRCKIGNFDRHAYRLYHDQDRASKLELSAPFRAPHHTCSRIGIFGRLDMHRWTPGEVSLAHGGILFLDDLPEFSRSIIEGLREPLETGFVTLANSTNVIKVPAKFRLIASAMLCPCGHRGMPSRSCDCPQSVVDRYLARIPQWLRGMCDVWTEY